MQPSLSSLSDGVASSTSLTSSLPKTKKPSVFHKYYKLIFEGLIRHHSSLITTQLVLISILPIIWPLIQAVDYPGRIICDNNHIDDCPDRKKPRAPDAVTLSIVSCVILYCVFWIVILLLASGSWMKHALRNKVISLIVLVLLVFALILVISPVPYRGYVHPYNSYQQYNIYITREDSNTALLTVNDYWTNSSATIWNPKQHVLVQVTKASGNENNLDELSPKHQRIYKDKKYSDTTQFTIGGTISRSIKGLKDNHWYMFTIQPARKGRDGHPYISSNLYYRNDDNKNNITLLDGSLLDDRDYIDRRLWLLCYWNETSGCVATR